MKSKIRTIDEGLRYLYQAKKECRNTLYAQIKMDVFRFLLGNIAAAGMLFRGKPKDSVNASKENIHKVKETLRRFPWRTLAYVACISCVAGIVSGKILSKKG